MIQRNIKRPKPPAKRPPPIDTRRLSLEASEDFEVEEDRPVVGAGFVKEIGLEVVKEIVLEVVKEVVLEVVEEFDDTPEPTTTTLPFIPSAQWFPTAQIK